MVISAFQCTLDILPISESTQKAIIPNSSACAQLYQLLGHFSLADCVRGLCEAATLKAPVEPHAGTCSGVNLIT